MHITVRDAMLRIGAKGRARRNLFLDLSMMIAPLRARENTKV